MTGLDAVFFPCLSPAAAGCLRSVASATLRSPFAAKRISAETTVARCARALILRFGLDGSESLSYRQVGQALGAMFDPGAPVSVERARRVVLFGLRMLRHPIRGHLVFELVLSERACDRRLWEAVTCIPLDDAPREVKWRRAAEQAGIVWPRGG